MSKQYSLTQDQILELKAARKANKDKNVENRLKALLMRAEGKKHAEIAVLCGYHPSHASKLVSKYCWCYPGLRPSVPCHHIREYRYAYGAVVPLTGESFFLVLPYSNTVCMSLFLQKLSSDYSDDLMVLVCDGAAWHKAKALVVPAHIRLIFLPPATPEMNPIEQVWKEIRKRGFRNEIFQTLNYECATPHLFGGQRVVDCNPLQPVSGSVKMALSSVSWQPLRLLRCVNIRYFDIHLLLRKYRQLPLCQHISLGIDKHDPSATCRPGGDSAIEAGRYFFIFNHDSNSIYFSLGLDCICNSRGILCYHINGIHIVKSSMNFHLRVHI